MPEVTGLLLVDKPAGQSSFGVLRGLRPALGRKLGHAGTLDPFATGLLLVVAGRATRLATYLSGLDKGYDAVVQFGAVSTTLDPEGEITPAGPATDADAVTAAAAGDDPPPGRERVRRGHTARRDLGALLEGHVRAPAGRRHGDGDGRRGLLPGAAADGR